jgi:hypothetical protein
VFGIDETQYSPIALARTSWSGVEHVLGRLLAERLDVFPAGHREPELDDVVLTHPAEVGGARNEIVSRVEHRPTQGDRSSLSNEGSEKPTFGVADHSPIT